MPPKKTQEKTGFILTKIHQYFNNKVKNGKKVTKKVLEETKVSQSLAKSNELPTFDEFADGLCSWKPKLENFIKSKKWKQIYDFIKPEYQTKTIYPPTNLIFNTFYLTSLKNLKVILIINQQFLKVVIVGQDPYYKPDQAMGIFMLNDILTVEADKPASHKKAGWIEFTDEVIKVINNECQNIIFLLWGEPAQKKAKVVNDKKHFILKACHPSPLSASKGGFFSCGHFSKVNEILAKIGKEPIDWNLPQ